MSLQELIQNYHILQKHETNCQLNAKYGINNQIWIDFMGLCYLLTRNSTFSFLLPLLSRLCQGYGISELSVVRCTNIARHNSIMQPHATNLDNREIMSFFLLSRRSLMILQIMSLFN